MGSRTGRATRHEKIPEHICRSRRNGDRFHFPYDWRASFGHLSAIVTFLMGIFLSVLILRALQARPSWPLLPTIMGIEAILIVAASLALAANVAYGVAIFVILVSLALGLQNGAFRRVGGVSVHTTYLTGMITSLISTETERYARQGVPALTKVTDPGMGLLCGVWLALSWARGREQGWSFILRRLGCWEPHSF